LQIKGWILKVAYIVDLLKNWTKIHKWKKSF